MAHLVRGEEVQQLFLGWGALGDDLGQASIEIEVFDISEVRLLRSTLLGTIRINERVRENAEQPGLQVRALFECGVTAVGLEIGLLHEIFCIGPITRHSQRRRIQALGMRHRITSKLRGISHESHTRFLTLRNEG